MGKRSQQSKERRKAERERKKRWGQQQKSLHTSQLVRDMAYYEERGLFASQTMWNETASQVLWDSQNWRSEPEFRDLTLDPYQTGQAMDLAWQELQFDPVEFEQLSADDKDERNFELNAQAIMLNLSPEFKKEFLRQLERYRLRLRANKQWEPLAQAGLTQMILETSDQANEPAWPECMLVYQIHQEAISEYLRLQDAAEAALDQALQAIGHGGDSPDSELSEEQRAQLAAEIEHAAQHTPGLFDFLERAADDLVDEALAAVQHGELHFDLFADREIDQFFAYFLAALVKSGVGKTTPEALPPAEVARVRQHLDEAIVECLERIDTPERCAELYAAARAALQRDSQENSGAALNNANLLLPLLDDGDLPLADNDFFIAAINGEFGRKWDAELTDEQAGDFDAES